MDVLAFVPSIVVLICTRAHVCPIHEQNREQRASERKWMGYDFDAKLGYHLLKHLKRHRWFTVHTRDMCCAIACLFPWYLRVPTFHLILQHYTNTLRARTLTLNTLNSNRATSYPQRIRIHFQSVHWKSSFTVQVFLRTNQNVEEKKKERKKNNGKKIAWNTMFLCVPHI